MENIFKILNKSLSEANEDIFNTLNKNPEYVEAQSKFEDIIKGLDKQLMSELSECDSAMETLSQEAGYSRGFMDAVNLLVICFSNKEHI